MASMQELIRATIQSQVIKRQQQVEYDRNLAEYNKQLAEYQKQQSPEYQQQVQQQIKQEYISKNVQELNTKLADYEKQYKQQEVIATTTSGKSVDNAQKEMMVLGDIIQQLKLNRSKVEAGEVDTSSLEGYAIDVAGSRLERQEIRGSDEYKKMVESNIKAGYVPTYAGTQIVGWTNPQQQEFMKHVSEMQKAGYKPTYENEQISGFQDTRTGAKLSVEQSFSLPVVQEFVGSPIYTALNYNSETGTYTLGKAKDIVVPPKPASLLNVPFQSLNQPPIPIRTEPKWFQNVQDFITSAPAKVSGFILGKAQLTSQEKTIQLNQPLPYQSRGTSFEGAGGYYAPKTIETVTIKQEAPFLSGLKLLSIPTNYFEKSGEGLNYGYQKGLDIFKVPQEKTYNLPAKYLPLEKTMPELYFEQKLKPGETFTPALTFKAPPKIRQVGELIIPQALTLGAYVVAPEIMLVSGTARGLSNLLDVSLTPEERISGAVEVGMNLAFLGAMKYGEFGKMKYKVEPMKGLPNWPKEDVIQLKRVGAVSPEYKVAITGERGYQPLLREIFGIETRIGEEGLLQPKILWTSADETLIPKKIIEALQPTPKQLKSLYEYKEGFLLFPKEPYVKSSTIGEYVKSRQVTGILQDSLVSIRKFPTATASYNIYEIKPNIAQPLEGWKLYPIKDIPYGLKGAKMYSPYPVYIFDVSAQYGKNVLRYGRYIEDITPKNAQEFLSDTKTLKLSSKEYFAKGKGQNITFWEFTPSTKPSGIKGAGGMLKVKPTPAQVTILKTQIQEGTNIVGRLFQVDYTTNLPERFIHKSEIFPAELKILKLGLQPSIKLNAIDLIIPTTSTVTATKIDLEDFGLRQIKVTKTGKQLMAGKFEPVVYKEKPVVKLRLKDMLAKPYDESGTKSKQILKSLSKQASLIPPPIQAGEIQVRKISPSVYYGKGMYERTGGGLAVGIIGRNMQVSQLMQVRNVQMLKPTQVQMNVQTLSQQMKLNQDMLMKQDLKMNQEMKMNMKQDLLLNQDMSMKMNQELSQNLQLQKQNLQQKQQLQQQMQVPVTTITTTIITPEIIPPIKIIIPPYNLPPGKSERILRRFTRKPTGKFIVMGRRFGKYKPLSVKSTLGEAVQAGKQFAKSTLGASFKVKGEKGYVGLVPGQGFRYGKVGRDITTLTQFANKRIKSMGEKIEIKQARQTAKFKMPKMKMRKMKLKW